MNAEFWRLPGPRRFLLAVADDLRSGKSVVLCLPETCPEGLFSALRRLLAAEDHICWQTLSAGIGDERSPADQLFARFLPQAAPEALRSARQLARESGFQGKLIAVSGICKANWPRWRAFLSEYEDAARAVDLLDRNRFCVACQGAPALDPPVEGVCLEVHTWEDVVDELDIRLFAAEQSRESRQSALARALWVEIVTQLAVWDPEVVTAFFGQSLDEVLEPKEDTHWDRGTASLAKTAHR
jgi:hypothetical protein